MDKIPKWVCRAVAPTLAASPELLVHRQNVDSVTFLMDETLEDVQLSWMIWFLLCIFFILIIYMIFCHYFWMF